MWLVGVAALAVLALPVLLYLSAPRRFTPPSRPQTQRLKFDEQQVRYESAGSGEPVLLFLHGFNSSLEEWDAVVASLGECPVRRIRLDVPGFGDSRWQADDYGLPMQAKRLVEILDTLKVSKAIVVGSSMGASLSAELAATAPERVSGLVLLAPSAGRGGLTFPGPFGVVLSVGWLRTAATAIAQSGLYRALFSDSMALQALTVTQTYGERWLVQLKDIEAPTVLMWSRGDRRSDPKAAAEVEANIKGSAMLWLDERAGHSIGSSRPAMVASAACALSGNASAQQAVAAASLSP